MQENNFKNSICLKEHWNSKAVRLIALMALESLKAAFYTPCANNTLSLAMAIFAANISQQEILDSI